MLLYQLGHRIHVRPVPDGDRECPLVEVLTDLTHWQPVRHKPLAEGEDEVGTRRALGRVLQNRGSGVPELSSTSGHRRHATRRPV